MDKVSQNHLSGPTRSGGNSYLFVILPRRSNSVHLRTKVIFIRYIYYNIKIKKAPLRRSA